MDISKAGNCTFKHKEGAVKKTKHPLVHLKQYHERNLVVESETEIEENKEDRTHVEDILDSFEKEETLEFVDTLVTEENMEEKLEKKSKFNGNWNFAENVMGLVIKDKFKRKRKRNNSTGKKKKVTYLDLSKCVASEEDTLPDINRQEFSGAQRKEEDVGDKRKEFTGALVMGTLNGEKQDMLTGADLLQTDNDWIVTGAPSVTGAQYVTGAHSVTGTCDSVDDSVDGTGVNVTGAQKDYIPVTGAHVTGAQEENIPVTGAPFTVTGAKRRDVRKTPDRISKARGRLSLSLQKNRVPENSVDVDDGEKVAEYRLGTFNSNTVNSKFHLIQSFFEIFARFLSFHV